jgi:hypothetical protein
MKTALSRLHANSPVFQDGVQLGQVLPFPQAPEPERVSGLQLSSRPHWLHNTPTSHKDSTTRQEAGRDLDTTLGNGRKSDRWIEPGRSLSSLATLVTSRVQMAKVCHCTFTPMASVTTSWSRCSRG